MGLLQTAGQLGYFAAIVISGIVLTGRPGESGLDDVIDERVVWTLLFVGFGVLYLLLNGIAIVGLLWRRRRPADPSATCSAPI